MGFEAGDELLTTTRLCEISLSQQKAKGLGGHRPKVGLFGHLGLVIWAAASGPWRVLSDFRVMGLPRIGMVIRTIRYLELGQGFGT